MKNLSHTKSFWKVIAMGLSAAAALAWLPAKLRLGITSTSLAARGGSHVTFNCGGGLGPCLRIEGGKRK